MSDPKVLLLNCLEEINSVILGEYRLELKDYGYDSWYNIMHRAISREQFEKAHDLAYDMYDFVEKTQNLDTLLYLGDLISELEIILTGEDPGEIVEEEFKQEMADLYEKWAQEYAEFAAQEEEKEEGPDDGFFFSRYDSENECWIFETDGIRFVLVDKNRDGEDIIHELEEKYMRNLQRINEEELESSTEEESDEF
jgi:hypothetical protein